jgi:hypothetical protein
MRPIVKIALFVVFFIALGGILAALIMFNKKHIDTSKARPDYVVTATALEKDFEDNEISASGRYINKVIEVSGSITSVTADSSHLNISLKTGNDLSSVICTFQSSADAAKLKAGDEVTLRGECSGFLMDVLMKNCAIVAKRK